VTNKNNPKTLGILGSLRSKLILGVDFFFRRLVGFFLRLAIIGGYECFSVYYKNKPKGKLRPFISSVFVYTLHSKCGKIT